MGKGFKKLRGESITIVRTCQKEAVQKKYGIISEKQKSQWMTQVSSGSTKMNFKLEEDVEDHKCGMTVTADICTFLMDARSPPYFGPCRIKWNLK